MAQGGQGAVRRRGRSRPPAGQGLAPRKAFDRAILDFVERLAHVTVLDPACGSGNFLYVAIHMLLDLEKEVIAYAADRGLSLVPQVSPAQLHGLEINPYAQQLAQVVIWIGYLAVDAPQRVQDAGPSGAGADRDDPCMDAILDLSDPEHPKEPEWPEAEFIVGNPPFLGGNKCAAHWATNMSTNYLQLMRIGCPAIVGPVLLLV